MTAKDATGEWAALAAADFETLLEAARVLASELRPPELLAQVLDLSARVAGAEAGSLLILDEAAGELSFHVSTGAAGSRLQGERLKVGEGVAGWVARERKPQIVNDVRKDPRWSARADRSTDHVTRSLVAVPVLRQGRCLGVLEGINKRDPGGFTSTDRRALEILAAQVAVALENARLFERLRVEKENLAALFAEMTDGAAVVDSSGRIARLNAAGARWLGLDPAAAEGTAWADARRPFAVQSVDGREEWTRKAGKSLILSVARQPRADGRGELLVFRDVTEQKREERMKRNFLSLVSHKLRTPLAVITGYAPLLLKDASLSALAQKGLAAIDAQGKRLAGLVDKLLRFTALESADLELSRESLVPKFEIENAAAALGAALFAPGVRWEPDAALDALPPVLADAEKFRDVFRHLIENAVKFNPGPDKRVRVAGAAEEGFVRFTVEDNGPGVPPEEIPRLFQAFHQIEENFTGQVEGAGLGLALCRRLVEAHGGTIAAGAASGGGTAVTVRWPRA